MILPYNMKYDQEDSSHHKIIRANTPASLEHHNPRHPAGRRARRAVSPLLTCRPGSLSAGEGRGALAPWPLRGVWSLGKFQAYNCYLRHSDILRHCWRKLPSQNVDIDTLRDMDIQQRLSQAGPETHTHFHSSHFSVHWFIPIISSTAIFH